VAAGTQHAQHLGVQSVFVPHMDDRIFAEDDVERFVCKRQRARLHPLICDSARQAQPLRTARGGIDEPLLDIDPDHSACIVLTDENDIHAAKPATNVQYSAICEINFTNDSGDFRGTAGRHEPFAPDQFQLSG
jgi:V8-like Glu-specific endopeptidase